MLDRFIYNFFGVLDNAIAKLETYAIKCTEWCWHSRVNLLNKRRKKHDKRRTNILHKLQKHLKESYQDIG